MSGSQRAAADSDTAFPAPRTVCSPRGARNRALTAPGPSAPHAASRTFSTTKENVRSDAHYVRRPGLRLSPVAVDIDAASPAPRTVCSPRGARKHALTASGPSAPHAASRTFSTTKENVRSDAHYVRRPGLRLSPVAVDIDAASPAPRTVCSPRGARKRALTASGPSAPHATSRTFSTTKKSVRSGANEGWLSLAAGQGAGGPGFASVRWWRTVSRYLPLCLRSPRAVPPACPVRPGAADGTPTSPRRAETRPSPAFVPLLIFRCPCYTVVKITA